MQTTGNYRLRAAKAQRVGVQRASLAGGGDRKRRYKTAAKPNMVAFWAFLLMCGQSDDSVWKSRLSWRGTSNRSTGLRGAVLGTQSGRSVR
jgi:hypothetical protein